MRIAVLSETDPVETRVAATPDMVKKYKALAPTSRCRPAPARKASIADAEFEAAGRDHRPECAGRDQGRRHRPQGPPPRRRRTQRSARRARSSSASWTLTATMLRSKTLADAGAAAFAMELMPRITRAQVMDVLSSQANLAGYRAVVDAAEEYGKAVADDDDRGRHGAGRPHLRHGRRRGRAPGDRHGAPPGRHRHRDRRAPGRQGAGRVARRQVRRRRGRGVPAGRDRRRLRQGDVQGVSGQAGRTRLLAHRQAGHRHHDGADPRPPGAEAGLPRHGRVDEAGVGHRRPRGRARRQLRSAPSRARSRSTTA